MMYGRDQLKLKISLKSGEQVICYHQEQQLKKINV